MNDYLNIAALAASVALAPPPAGVAWRGAPRGGDGGPLPP